MHLADDELLVLQDHEPLDHVLQLADVAGPCVGLKQFLQPAGDLPGRAVVPSGIAVDEELAELRDLAAPLAERRHRHFDDLEAIVQILAELRTDHHQLEVAVRGGDDPHVHVDRSVAAELRELRILKHVQQLGLEGGFQLSYLVQEDRAGVRLLEFSDAGGGGPGEGALLVAEQLAFEQFLWQRRTVDLHKRLALPGRPLMDGPRDQLLADAALAADEHRDVAVGHLLDDRGNRRHLRVVSPEEKRAVLVVGQLLPELADLRDQAALLDGALDRRVERDLAEALWISGLDHVVRGAEPDGLHDG